MARYNESTDNDNITTLDGNPRKFLKHENLLTYLLYLWKYLKIKAGSKFS